MTTWVYVIGSFLVFLMIVAFGRGESLREALIHAATSCALPLAAVILWIPYRVDFGSILPMQYPHDDDAQRLTQILFTFGSFLFAMVCIGFWLSTTKGSPNKGQSEN